LSSDCGLLRSAIGDDGDRARHAALWSVAAISAATRAMDCGEIECVGFGCLYFRACRYAAGVMRCLRCFPNRANTKSQLFIPPCRSLHSVPFSASTSPLLDCNQPDHCRSLAIPCTARSPYLVKHQQESRRYHGSRGRSRDKCPSKWVDTALKTCNTHADYFRCQIRHAHHR
jgi:hypothetical protein